MRRARNIVRRSAAVFGVAALAASAWAQDYVKTNATGLLESRPSGATALHMASGSTASGVQVSLPFTFHWYCRPTTVVFVTPCGFVLPFSSAGFPNEHTNYNAVGRDATSNAFPYTGGTGADGVIAPIWDNLQLAGNSSGGDTFYWITGTAPNRHFVVSWENFQVGSTSNPRLAAVQVQLFETSDRIVFAFDATTSGYAGAHYVCGIDSPIDGRFMAPLLATNQNSGYPGSDFVFDPRPVTITGTLLYDKIVSDASGIVNSVSFNRPLSNCTAQLQRASDGFAYASATTASDGTFSITGYALPAATPGALVALAQNAECRVAATSAAATTAWTAVGSVSFASDSNQGTRTLGASADANGDLRAAFNVARACGVVGDWALARTSDSIPRIDVLVDSTSSLATRYSPAGSLSAAFVQVGSRAASNPDVWDDALVTRTYGRHVLASIAGAPTTTYDDRFDAVTDPQNAFADGFGNYLWAAVSGASTAIDGAGPSTAVVYDLEHPAVTVTKGPDVAGCMAGALYDLLDPANESTDPVDGSSTPGRVLQLADGFTVAPTAATFLQAWVDAGFDAAGITRVFVGNGVLADDGYEPNDSASEAAALGAPGFLPKTLVLNRFNEDWFSVTLPAAAASFAADAKYDHVTTGATVAVEIRDAGGATLATGTLVPTTGAVHAATGPVSAGTYKVRVQHVSGGTVPSYVFQAYVPPTVPAAPLVDWTVGRRYDVPLGVVGGIAPFVVATPSSSMPTGLVLNSTTLRAGGTPTTLGAFQVTVQVADSGDPANVASFSQTVTIHDVLKLPIAPFVAFPAGRSIDATLPTHEGTPPLTLTSTGALPNGLAFDAGTFHVAGTAAAQPSVALSLDGVDVAGSADHVDLRALVAVQLTGKSTPANLVAGTDACGWWFDAVKGSTVSFSVATAKKQAKRALTGILLAPDRSAVAGGKIVGKLGAVSASKLVCPASGRYCFVASTTDAGAATQLLGTLVMTPPKSGKGSNAAFDPSATTTVAFGALPGSTVTLKFSGDAKKQLVAKLVSVTGPDGVAVPLITLAGFGKATATGGTLTMPLATGGTWTVVLGATSQSGTPGKLTYSYTLKQSKNAYSAD